MIWIFICPIVIFIMFTIAIIQEYNFDGMFLTILRSLGSFFLSAFVGVMLGLIIAILMGMFLIATPTEEYQVSKQEIYSVKDNMPSSGGFVLGTGMVKSDLKIYYVVETEYGKQIQSQSKEEVYIKESDAETPNLEIISIRFKHRWLDWIGFCLASFDDIYIITVPTDTIEVQYSIDMD